MAWSTIRPATCSLCPVPAGEMPRRAHFVRQDMGMGSRVWEVMHTVKIQAFRNEGSHPRPLPLHLPTSTEKSPLLFTAEGTDRGSKAPAIRERTHRGGTRYPAQKGTGLPRASTA